MSTLKQIAASRANGAKSKGPVTPQGKRNSSRNSTRHGIFAATIVLESEDSAAFLELIDDLYQEHQPSTPTEMMLVDTIAAARWRQDRIWGIQKTAFDEDVASGDPAAQSPPPLRALKALRGSADNVRAHELLLRYEIALDRQLSRAILRLQQMQDRRNAPSPAEKKKTAPVERTQQPAESKRPPTAAIVAKTAPANQTTASNMSPCGISSKEAAKAPTRRT